MLNRQSSTDIHAKDYVRLDPELMDYIDLTPYTDEEMDQLRSSWKNDNEDAMLMSFEI